MPPRQKFPFAQASLTDVLLLLRQNVMNALNCTKIGEIQSFDPARKTASVRILFKRVRDDQTVVSYPLLVDCPVVTLQGGGAAVRLPIKKGDQCLLFFADRNIDIWLKTGNEAAPETSRTHDLSDGFALVGVNALTSAMEAYKTDEAEIQYGTAVLGMKGNKFRLKNGTTDLNALVVALINAIEGIQVVGNLALTPASVTALEAVKTQFAGLLYS